MSSAISTEDARERSTARRRPSPAAAPAAPDVSIWHVYALLGLMGAAAAVWTSHNAQPLALVLLSAASLAVAFVAAMIHRALASFWGQTDDTMPLDERRRDVLQREKMLVLRSIKELEFDRSMGKIGDADFNEIAGRLRARALTLMEDIDRASVASERTVGERPASDARPACPTCGTRNEHDARFCKQCGKPL